MFLLLISVVGLFLCLWWCLQWMKVKNYWRERGVPHYPPHPVWGSLTFLQRQNPSLLADYTTDIIGESAFGVTSESVKTGDSVMRQVTKEFSQFSVFRGLCWSSIFFYPELVDVFGFTFFPKATVERLRLICRSVIRQRGGYEKELSEPRDLLDALIKMKQVATSQGEEMTEDFILAQASILLLGGFDTTAATMSWIIYELAWHPECQQKLYEEIINSKEKTSDNESHFSALSNFTYFDCVIKETLRFFPPMGWLDRVALKDYQVDENLTITAGTPVYVNAVAMHVDAKYFPDPLVFNPDRFLPENEKKITPFTYLPFGEGPRSCIGMRFGHRVMTQALSSLVYNFYIEALPNTPKPLEVQVENKGMFFMPLDDRMVVKFVPREH